MNINYDLIFAFAFAGALIQEVPLWNRFLDAFSIDVKPFNCALCFTFWMSLGPAFISTGVFAIFNSIIAAVLADLINRQMNRV